MLVGNCLCIPSIWNLARRGGVLEDRWQWHLVRGHEELAYSLTYRCVQDPVHRLFVRGRHLLRRHRKELMEHDRECLLYPLLLLEG